MPHPIDDPGRYRIVLPFDGPATRQGQGNRGQDVVVIQFGPLGPGRHTAGSLQQLVALLNQNGIGPSFSGTYMIEDATHHTAGVSVHGWDPKKKQPFVGKPKAGQTPGRRLRLAGTAPRAALDIQQALLNAGFSQASYVLDD